MGVDQKRIAILENKIKTLVEKSHLKQDLSLEWDDLDTLFLKLDGYLCELKEAQIRDGLHIFGCPPKNDLKRDLLIALHRNPTDEKKSIPRAILQDLNVSVAILQSPYETPFEKSINGVFCRTIGKAIAEVETLAQTLLDGYLQNTMQDGWKNTRAVFDWIADNTLVKIAQTTNEITHLLQGLSGAYVPSGASGAPTRGRLDLLPTGRNFYAVDVRTVPTETAYEIGVKSADRLIERYLQEQGDYPKTVGLSVWGTATMRTGGDDIAQAFALMGVKPIWKNINRTVRDFEVIPLLKLGRPRVDVVLRVSGFFRDAFPDIINLFNAVVEKVAHLEEPLAENPIKERFLKETTEWQKKGLPEDKAKERSLYRVFGSKPGAYGAGLQAVIDEKNWKSDADLSEVYIQWSAYAYTRSKYGVSARESFENRLKTMEVVLQNQDNREHDLLDSDDYYQFQGGLANAVKNTKGTIPTIYFGDHSNVQQPKIKTLKEELLKVYRSRAVNPKWIKGVRRHGYKGAFEMSATLDYLFAYDATTDLIDDFMYEGITDAYLKDPENRAFLEQNNPWVVKDMSERLLEAMQRDDDFFTLNTHYTINGTAPNGLTLAIKKIGSGMFVVILSGTANPHTSDSNVNLKLTFLPAMFNGNPAADKIIGSTQTIKEKNVQIGFLRQDIDFEKGRTVLQEAYQAFTEILQLESKMTDINEQLATRTDYESNGYADLMNDLEEVTTRYEMIGGYHYQAETEKILKGLGFTQADFHNLTETFSGGWRMRIELAKLLLQKNDLLLLDEPTNHLDIESIIWLEDFLKRYAGAVMLVSHDKQFLDNVTNRTIEIVKGKLYDYKKPYSQYLVLREELRTQQLQAQKNQERTIKQKEQLIEKFRAKASKASMAQSLIKQLDKIERIAVDERETAVIKLRFQVANQPGKVVLSCEQVFKSFGEKNVLSGVDLELERGDKIAFVGQNGQGKSTLAKILVGVEKASLGVVNLGHNVQVSFFAQNQAAHLDGEKTLLETMEAAANDHNRAKVRDFLGSFLFRGDDVDKKIKVLSGGERNRLAICKMLLQPFNVLVMDEPTNHLDIASKNVLKTALQQFEGTLIIVSHDRDFLTGLTEKTVGFRNQKVKMYLGDVNYFLEANAIENMREVEKRTVEKKLQKSSPKQNKEGKQLKNKIGKLERKIDQLENEIATMEVLFFETPEKAKNPDLLNDYQRKKQALEKAMTDWESLQNTLEKN
uniref:Aerobic cobaltochelatase subunit CobN n=1 Tax=Stylophora pistillata TaxID=50429 RepID=A0A2B4R9Z9_STYPI